MELKKGKKFYGAVTVSERGQIVIPVEARKDFDIHTGDKLLVMGDLNKGIALAKPNLVLAVMEGTLTAVRKFEAMVRSRETGSEGEEDGEGEGA